MPKKFQTFFGEQLSITKHVKAFNKLYE